MRYGISSEPLTQRETQREYEQRLYDSGMSSEPLTQEEKNLVKSSAKESGISEENSEYLIRLLKYKD